MFYIYIRTKSSIKSRNKTTNGASVHVMHDTIRYIGCCIDKQSKLFNKEKSRNSCQGNVLHHVC